MKDKQRDIRDTMINEKGRVLLIHDDVYEKYKK